MDEPTVVPLLDGCKLLTQGAEMALLDASGKVLLPFALHQIRYNAPLQAYIVRENKLYGIFLPNQGWLLPPAYTSIKPLKPSAVGYFNERLAVVKHLDNAGVFVIGDNPRWMMPMVYRHFMHLSLGFLAYREKGFWESWGLADFHGQLLGKCCFFSINGKNGYLNNGVALGFFDRAIYILHGDGNAVRINRSQAEAELAFYPEEFYTKHQIHCFREEIRYGSLGGFRGPF
ncbi:hypothetical protein CLV59_103155 [Chitinophaga dinghuensis]|uniref:WG repeat protein n=1 Tax=Chitinophaga dinghuensis TaxID=1539050 RepID=A0A327W4V0_9BACT|nr:hypothetical protein [Chitinophaga dinghuensis]RAJ83195.1 hypothetical protein CLV59_103155 [Chitinophaga dinghuensis]